MPGRTNPTSTSSDDPDHDRRGARKGHAPHARARARQHDPRAAHRPDIQATIRNLVGGEVLEYTKLIAESREQAIDRAIAEAERLGANAIVGIRFTTAEVMSGAAEILVYGTAVVLEPER